MSLKKPLTFLIGLTYFLVVWGALVRGTGSGLGCPDWPMCHGQWLPPMRVDVWIEYIHRLLASLVGIGMLFVAFKIGCNGELRRKAGRPVLVALGLLIFQSLLGAKVVLTELEAGLVAVHMGTAMIFLAYLITIYLKSADRWERTSNPWALVTLLLLLAQIVLGALTAANHAGLACPEFPMCQGGAFLPTEGLPLLHFFHRWLGITVMGLIGWLAWRGWPCPINKIIFFLGFFQVLLGIGNIFMGLPVWMRVAHSATASLLFIVLFVMTHGSRKRTN